VATEGTVEHHLSQDGYAAPDCELLRFAFRNELLVPVLREPAKSHDDIRAFNDFTHWPVELFFDTPDCIGILGAQQIDIDDDAPMHRTSSSNSCSADASDAPAPTAHSKVATRLLF
jgi:hypothetical protein